MKCVLGWSKNEETLVLCSRKIMKLYNFNMRKETCIEFLPLVSLYDFVWKDYNLLFLSVWKVFVTVNGYILPKVFDFQRIR